MVSVRPFDPADVDGVVAVQLAQADEMAAEGDWRAMARQSHTLGPAWTAEADGRVLGCAGFRLRWRGNAFAWCFLAEGVPAAAWVAIHRAVRQRMTILPAFGVWRCEAWVRHGFAPGHRWVEMLGFAHEGISPGLAPDGGTLHRYGRIWR